MGANEVPSDGRFATTWQNRAAGRALRSARLSAGDGNTTQADFAARLSSGLGTEISAAALSNYESGRRGVPSAVLIEAGLVSGSTTDALLAKSGEPRLRAKATEPVPEAGLSSWTRRFDEQSQLVLSVRREVQDQARLLARLRRRLEQAGITLAETSDEESERQETQGV